MALLVQLCIILSLCYLVNGKPLMLLMLDGFRWDYVDMYYENLVGFPRLLRQGVRAQHVVMDFPTLSMPNQYTLMTGLYNEYHGIVSDDMYDPKTKKEFEYRPVPQPHPEEFWWDHAEPIWIAAEKQNKTAYIYHWPYCDLELKGFTATSCSPYQNIATMSEIIHAAKKGVSLLANSSADLVGIFVRSTDFRAHYFGPESENVARIIKNIDTQINRILNMLSEDDSITLMVLSSHGMTAVSPERVIYISDIIQTSDVERYLGNSAYLGVWPKPGKFDKVYNLLRASNHKLLTYKREDTPEVWHFRNHARIPPIVVTAAKGWTILRPGKRYRQYGKERNKPEKGNHGYDNNIPDMRGSFFVTGPDFKSDYVSDPIHAVDVYQIICKVLQMEPSPHNGTWNNVSSMFKTSDNSATVSSGRLSHWMVAFFVVLLRIIHENI